VALSSRDRTALLALLEHAQLVYLLTRYPKKQVLDDAADVKRLVDGLAAMRETAKRISGSLKERETGVPWDLVSAQTDDPDAAWAAAKKTSPKVLAALTPLVEGEPKAAFFLRPIAATPKTHRARTTKTATGPRAPRRPDRAARRPAREGTGTSRPRRHGRA
jgi:hypothetical protein